MRSLAVIVILASLSSPAVGVEYRTGIDIGNDPASGCDFSLGSIAPNTLPGFELQVAVVVDTSLLPPQVVSAEIETCSSTSGLFENGQPLPGFMLETAGGVLGSDSVVGAIPRALLGDATVVRLAHYALSDSSSEDALFTRDGTAGGGAIIAFLGTTAPAPLLSHLGNVVVVLLLIGIGFQHWRRGRWADLATVSVVVLAAGGAVIAYAAFGEPLAMDDPADSEPPDSRAEIIASSAMATDSELLLRLDIEKIVLAPPTATSSPTNSPTETTTPAPTSTPTQTATPTPTQTPTSTPTTTSTQAPTLTPTATPTVTATQTPSQTATFTLTETPTETATETPTETATPLFDIEPLTDNAVVDSNPRVYGNRAVWQGAGGTDGGTDSEIFYYDGTNIIQLTENSEIDQYPQLSGLGIAWERGSGATKKIVYHDATSETVLDSTPLTIASNVFTLTDDRLSWEDSREADIEIFTWTGSGTPANQSNNTLTDRYVDGDANNLVWVENDAGTRNVRFFNGTSNTTIATSTFAIEDPKISGQIVAWEGFKGSLVEDREIFYYDGSTAQQLSDNGFPDFDPRVSGQHIVWWGGVFNDFQIYWFDGAMIHEISTGTRNQFPEIDGPYVVWQGTDGNDDEIFLWDGTTVRQVTDNSIDDTQPHISGNHIIWQGGSGTAQEIYHTFINP